MPRKKKTKKRVKREPKPPTWVTFMCVNHTREEVYFGVSQNRPKWTSSRYDLQGVPELAHWDIWEDRTRMSKLYKRKPFPTKEDAQIVTRNWERWYDHNRHFWVIQTGPNLKLTPRERKPVKPPRVPSSYRLPDIDEADEIEEDDDIDDGLDIDDGMDDGLDIDDDVDLDSEADDDDEELEDVDAIDEEDEEIGDGLEFEDDLDPDLEAALDDDDAEEEDISDGLEFEQDHDFDPDLVVD